MVGCYGNGDNLWQCIALQKAQVGYNYLSVNLKRNYKPVEL